jgi:hypothetical protein
MMVICLTLPANATAIRRAKLNIRKPRPFANRLKKKDDMSIYGTIAALVGWTTVVFMAGFFVCNEKKKEVTEEALHKEFNRGMQSVYQNRRGLGIPDSPEPDEPVLEPEPAPQFIPDTEPETEEGWGWHDETVDAGNPFN